MAITHTEVAIAGKPRRLRFDVNAISEALEHLGKGLDAVPLLPACRALVWVGIKHGERRPRFTLEDAGGLITEHLEVGGVLGELATALFRAVGQAFPEPPSEGDPGNARAPEGTPAS